MPVILAIDPSLKCTGWAVMKSIDDVVYFGRVTTKESKPYLDRLHETADDLLGLAAEYKVERIIVETPAEHIRGGKNRAVVSGATYGFLAGGVYMHLRAMSRIPVEGVPATVWTRNLGAARGTRNDPDKENRVRHVEYYYRHLTGKLGPKTVAGNIADAILIGRWLYQQSQNSPRLIA